MTKKAQAPITDFASDLEFRRLRYAQVEREPDSLGRMIGVRRLKLSEQTRMTAMTPDLGGVDEIANPEMPGATVLVSQRAQYYLVAMVCEIAGVPIPFPRNRGELDSILDRLDVEGMMAASVAATRLMRPEDENGNSEEEALEKAKNL